MTCLKYDPSWLHQGDCKTCGHTADAHLEPVCEAFVIIDPKTGETLPEVGRGYTHTEPGPGLPRLLHSRAGANQALAWWLKGPVHAEMEYDHFDGFGGASHAVGPAIPDGQDAERVARGLVVRRVTIHVEAD